MAGLKEVPVKWNHDLCVELSADYLLVDRANLYQTGETQLKKMSFPSEIRLKERKSSSEV